MHVNAVSAAARADLAAPGPLDPGGVALFTDLDGTLAPLVERPGLVKPDAVRRRLLARLQRALHGRLAVISGRGLDDLDRILEHDIVALSAAHGLVRRSADGVVRGAPRPEALDDAREALEAFVKADRGLLLEDKGPALALHYRRSPGAAEACQDVVRRLAIAGDLVVQQGDMVIELRAPGPDKGDAMRAFMTEAPFAGALPVFIGDDLTDEHGFEAAVALGGYGVIVGARRPTAALYALPDVAAALAWMDAAGQTGAVAGA
ncbi:trehalose-phosphatase [Caulobacter sp. KR2-114]|uniref:trehalose-phosphatase n=1 Tax=Caulobacter sp. KR2-114 TaxID=3400912 RepID=UPI003C0E3C49